MLTLYHMTSADAGWQIFMSERIDSKEYPQRAYFSDRPDGQAAGYGDTAVVMSVPSNLAHLEDEFPDGETHYWVSTNDLRPEHFIRIQLHRYIRNED